MGTIVVQRQLYFSRKTMGELLLPDRHLCWTMEDEFREVLGEDGKYHWRSELKVPKQTAIPAGRYQVVLNFSARFQRILPMFIGVPDFIAIRFHGGNDEQDVEGCIALGMVRDASKMRIANSAPAVDALIGYLQAEEAAKVKSYVEVRNA